MPTMLTFHGQFATYRVWLKKSRYVSGGNLAIEAFCDDGLAFRATVNLEGQTLPHDEIAVKDYGENVGVLAFLRENGIVTDIVRWVKSGYVTIPICKIDLKRLEELTR